MPECVCLHAQADHFRAGPCKDQACPCAQFRLPNTSTPPKRAKMTNEQAAAWDRYHKAMMHPLEML